MSGDFNSQGCEQTVQSFFWPHWREFTTCAKYAYTVITVQAQVAQKADNSYPPDKRCPAIRRTDLFSYGNLDK